MLNRSASLEMSTSVLKALPGKLDFKRREPGILYIPVSDALGVSPNIVSDFRVDLAVSP